MPQIRGGQELLKWATMLAKVAASEGRLQPVFSRAAADLLGTVEPSWQMLLDGTYAREVLWLKEGRTRGTLHPDKRERHRRWTAAYRAAQKAGITTAQFYKRRRAN